MENENASLKELKVGYDDRGRIIGMLINFLDLHLPQHPYTKLLVEYKDMKPADLLVALHGHPTFVKSNHQTISKERLREIRDSLSMTQKEFAIYVGNVSMRAVQDWEYGERSIPSTVVEILRLNGHL